MLSNRELAVVIWMAALLLFLMVRSDIRPDVVDILRPLFTGLIGRVLLIMTLYAVLLVLGLHRIGLWNAGSLKDTIVWYLFSAPYLAFRSASRSQDTAWFYSVVRDSLRIYVIVSFLTWRYTFGLATELVLVLVLVVLGGCTAIAEADGKYVRARKALVIVTYGLSAAIFVKAVVGAISDFGKLASLETASEVILPSILTICFVPFLYALAVYVAYDRLFVRLKMGSASGRGLVPFSERLIVCLCGFSLGRLRQFNSRCERRLMQIGSKRQLFEMVADFYDEP